MLEGGIDDFDDSTSIVTVDHKIGLVVREQSRSEVLNLHVIIFNVDQGFVIVVEVLEVAVLECEAGDFSWVDRDSTREIVQIEQHSVSQVVNLAVGINFKERLMVRLVDQLA